MSIHIIVHILHLKMMYWDALLFKPKLLTTFPLSLTCFDKDIWYSNFSISFNFYMILIMFSSDADLSYWVVRTERLIISQARRYSCWRQPPIPLLEVIHLGQRLILKVGMWQCCFKSSGTYALMLYTPLSSCPKKSILQYCATES
jgi:hypothetical protein